MRISQVTIKLSADDINRMLQEFAPDVKLRIVEIRDDGIYGQFKFLMWNIDFIARPHSYKEREEVAVEVSARMLVPIPASIVERSLQEAVKDAPQGLEVLRQVLKLHVPTILSPFKIQLKVRDFSCHNGAVVIDVADCELGMLKGMLPFGGGTR
ncbi:hypothetical protein [Alicyclobacillus acidoterrestris]|uniref:Uncharacterized protein n=1 Tax=Alicyclobacillus acidoterrestris (strain ATCC 49025 / DSM 3922 / CIP 106132 / NCIMB 13137 / GD3B) TaxID=1356854 RepID=T0DHT3_ALIAG|nr:hypothetical protein [Alicyclobacillus acidoterrestris]EPZ50897.1 hypothetical protein N007_20955 [Alicyclobacillus acidoterrestris ATCC 49025]UNO49013.1 hypothetical protein K1I37_00095 [Alicyclobacillus acidoterrestris]